MSSALSRLELTQALGRWSGTELPSDITSTTSPDTDHVGDLVAMVDQAWQDIQLERHTRWMWMRDRSVNTVALTASTRTLAMSAIGSTCWTVIPFIAHDTRPLRHILLKHPTTDAIHRCEYVPYEYFRGYRDKGTRPENRPTRFTIRNDGTLEFDPTPDVAYKIDCDWVKVPEEMTADNSEPDMPNHFHMLIVWWAMVHLMDFDENNYRYQLADRQYKRMFNRLCIEQIAESNHDEYLSTNEVYGW